MGLRVLLGDRRSLAEASLRFVDIRYHDEGEAIAWRLLEERPLEANISHGQMPSRAEHADFVALHPYRQWLVIETDVILEPKSHRLPVGTIYATHRNEIGIAILREYRRQGWAKRAIEHLIEFLPPMPASPGVRNPWWTANVAPSNQASLGLFRSLGGSIIAVTYQLPERGAGHGEKG